jgi:hypothetical protein
LHGEPKSKIRVIYGSRYEDQIIFKKQLDALEASFADRLQVLHVISKPSASWPGLKGRINQASTVYYLKQEFGLDIAKAHYFLCGPVGMMDDVQAALGIFDVPADQIHKELFNAAPSADTSIEDNSVAREITLIYEGKSHAVTVQPHETILEAALEADLDIPYSCQAGMCTACIHTVRRGGMRAHSSFFPGCSAWSMECVPRGGLAGEGHRCLVCECAVVARGADVCTHVACTVTPAPASTCPSLAVCLPCSVASAAYRRRCRRARAASYQGCVSPGQIRVSVKQ